MMQTRTGLVRAIGRWSLVALVVNSIIGSGVFGLPGVLAGLLGRRSVMAVVLAGAGAAVIMSCFAEVASQFGESGGPYLYVRTAFGRLLGIQTGWLLWLSQSASPAANANLFVIYLAEFWPQAREPLPRFIILTVLIGGFGWINIRGVQLGTRVNNLSTIAKLVPLVGIALAGLALAAMRHFPMGVAAGGTGDWPKGLLLCVFAYGGFESALMPLREAMNPRRDTPFALLTAVLGCTLLYATIQYVVVALLPATVHSERPLAEVARVVFGSWGAAVVALGALLSVLGYLSAKLLGVPRVMFALAEQGDFPTLFGRVHARFHTPAVSIAVFMVFTWVLALVGSFAWNVTLSAVPRLFCYAMVCAALPVLRRKQPGAAQFRLPAGVFFAVLGIVLCLALVTRADFSKSLIVAGIVLIGLMNWAWARWGRRAEAEF
jgi:amino acid transporter